MGNLRKLMSWISDRRKRNVPVKSERRERKMRLRDADRLLSDSLERLDQTIIRHRNGADFSAHGT